MTKTYEFPVIIEKDEDNILIASVPSIPNCHTHAKTMTTLMKRIKEAIELCLEVQDDIRPNKFICMQEVEVSVRR